MDLLYRIDHRLIVVILAGLLLLTTEVGFRVGRHVATRVSDGLRSQITGIEAAMLGLVGLLLSFTFSMAVSRFDARRLLVLEESNGIGTAYLRTAVLNDPARTELRQLLRQYVEARLAFYEEGIDEVQLRDAVHSTDALQRAFWSRAVEEARKDPHAITTGLLLESLNNVIDTHAKRVTAMEATIPGTVLMLRFIATTFGLGAVGYTFGLVQRRNVLATTVLVLLVTVIVFVILDLDRPRRGLVRVSQQSMLDLREALRRDAQ